MLDRSPRKPTENGFVLITVLWALSILSVIAITLSLIARLDIKTQGNLQSAAQSDVLADGIIRLVAWRLTQPQTTNQPDALPRDGTQHTCKIGELGLTVSVRDVAGLVDINAASVDLLDRLLQGLDVEASKAIQLAEKIANFRSAVPSVGALGAEAENYRLAGLSLSPKRAPFEAVGELDQVLGVSDQLLDALRPLTTVHSRSPGIDPKVASLELLKALSDAPKKPGTSLRLEKSRESLQPPARFVTQSPSRAFVVTVTVANPTWGRRTREATIEISPRSSQHFLVRSWGSARPRQSSSVSMVTDCAGLLF